MSLEGKRILVVEDEPIIAMMTEDWLAELGAVPIGPAASVADALQLAAANELDAALIDLNLRGESGDAVAEALAARGVPFVVATGYAAPPSGRDYPLLLRKPYVLEELRAALAHVLG